METITSPKTGPDRTEEIDMNARPATCSIDTVLFDFGGVLAEEGFANGLRTIARNHGLDDNEFLELARELIDSTGYLTGRANESAYWQAVRDRTRVAQSDEELRNEILSRFVLRPFMFDIVRKLKRSGVRVAILSDQTNWLDELDATLDFFTLFDAVYNSYHLGKSKADGSHFPEIVARMKDIPERVLFIDDNDGHCQRARDAGLNAIRYTGRDAFEKEFALYCRL